ncbi:MAG: TonB-dependent receptor [Pseudomonadota bacterium]|nr:TonB-dependent receptor [Pseudomonadota bacterium]
MSNLAFRLLPLVCLMPATVAMAAETILPTTVITASRIQQPLKQVLGDISVIERAELERYSGETVLEVLKTQAGIQIRGNGGIGKSSSIFMRGTNSSHTLVLIDGVRYGSASGGAPAVEHLPVEQIERIEILRGAAASLYGSDAVGGVIQIFTRQGQVRPQAFVSLGAGNYGSVQASTGISGTWGQTQAALTVSHSETDGVSAVSNSAGFGYDPDKDGYRNTSLGLNLSQKINAQLSVGATSLLAKVNNQYDGGIGHDSYNDGYNGAANLWATMRFSPQIQSDLKIGRSIDDNDNYGSGGKSSFKTEQTQYQLQNTADMGRFGTALLGLERLEQQIESDTAFAQTQRKVDSALLGYVFEHNQFSLQANLRHDQNSQFDNETTYSVGAGWRFLPTWQLGASMGTSFKAPSFNELYWPDEPFFKGNPSLRPETGKNHEVFVRHDTETIHTRLTAYQNEIKDLLAYQFPTTVNIDQALIQGLTLQADWQDGLWQVGGSYDFLDAKDRSIGANRNKQLTYRAKHTGMLYAGIAESNWQVRAEIEGANRRFTNPANTTHLGGYSLVNLSGSVDIRPDLTLGLRINNLFDKAYELTPNYGTLGTNGMLTLTYRPTL